MAHTTRRLTDTAWVEIAADSVDFDVFNPGPREVHYCLASSTPPEPDDDNVFHILPDGERIARGNLTDALYMRSVAGPGSAIQRISILT